MSSKRAQGTVALFIIGVVVATILFGNVDIPKEVVVVVVVGGALWYMFGEGS